MGFKKLTGGITLLAVLAVLATVLPDIKRYIKMREM